MFVSGRHGTDAHSTAGDSARGWGVRHRRGEIDRHRWIRRPNVLCRQQGICAAGRCRPGSRRPSSRWSRPAAHRPGCHRHRWAPSRGGRFGGRPVRSADQQGRALARRDAVRARRPPTVRQANGGPCERKVRTGQRVPFRGGCARLHLGLSLAARLARLARMPGSIKRKCGLHAPSDRPRSRTS